MGAAGPARDRVRGGDVAAPARRRPGAGRAGEAVLVIALPMLAALRRAAGAARITLIGRWAPLLAGQEVGDVLLPYPRPFAARRRLARALAADRADVALLLPSSLEAALAATRWRARRRVGYATDGRRALLTDAMPLPAPRLHQVDEYAALLSLLGLDGAGPAPEWKLPASPAAEAEVARLAAAVGVATVTLFGPTDRRLTAPRGRGARALDQPVPCAPCFLPTCPIDHICLTRIDPETVLREVRLAVA